MAKLSLIHGLIAACLVSTSAHAQMAVIDTTSIGQLIKQYGVQKDTLENAGEQLKTATESLEQVNKAREELEAVNSTIGELATFKISLPNGDAIKSRLISDLMCQIPNRPTYGFEFDEWVQASFCDRTVKYRESLFNDEEDWSALDWFEQKTKRQELEKNRQSLLADTSVNTLAKADVILNSAEEVHESINDIDAGAQSAETVQEKLARLNDHLAVLNRQQADTNVLLAHMAKTQTAMFVKLGLKFDDLRTKEEDTE